MTTAGRPTQIDNSPAWITDMHLQFDQVVEGLEAALKSNDSELLNQRLHQSANFLTQYIVAHIPKEDRWWAAAHPTQAEHRRLHHQILRDQGIHHILSAYVDWRRDAEGTLVFLKDWRAQRGVV